MIDINLATIIVFLISLVISAIIIYFVTKIFEEKEGKEGFGTALLAAFIGSIIYAAAYYFLRPELGWLASLIGGIVWLIALGSLYNIGWLKALVIAVIIWIISAIVGIFLPTMIGPL